MPPFPQWYKAQVVQLQRQVLLLQGELKGRKRLVQEADQVTKAKLNTTIHTCT